MCPKNSRPGKTAPLSVVPSALHGRTPPSEKKANQHISVRRNLTLLQMTPFFHSGGVIPVQKNKAKTYVSLAILTS
jgi:hypothetical protein